MWPRELRDHVKAGLIRIPYVRVCWVSKGFQYQGSNCQIGAAQVAGLAALLVRLAGFWSSTTVCFFLNPTPSCWGIPKNRLQQQIKLLSENIVSEYFGNSMSLDSLYNHIFVFPTNLNPCSNDSGPYTRRTQPAPGPQNGARAEEGQDARRSTR